MRNLLFLALMSLPFMTVIGPAVAAEPTVKPTTNPTEAGFTAKSWDQTPEWEKIPDGTATIALVMGRDESSDRAAERLAMQVLEGLSFVQTDGRMFFGHNDASRTNIDGFVTSLHHSRNLVVYYEGPGAGHEEGDPVFNLSDTTYRVAALKKTLAGKAENVVIITAITNPDGPTANDFVSQGPEINGAFISPTLSCDHFSAKMNNALYGASTSGEDITIGDLVDRIGCGTGVVRYSGETTEETVLFPGNGIVTQVEEPVQPPVAATTLPTQIHGEPSPFVRELPKVIPGAALVIGAGVVAGIANVQCRIYDDPEWARQKFPTWKDYDAAADTAIPVCNGMMIGAGIGGVVGIGFLGWGGASLAFSAKPNAGDVRITVPW